MFFSWYLDEEESVKSSRVHRHVTSRLHLITLFFFIRRALHGAGRDASLVQLLLQPGNLLQALRLADHLLDALLLLFRQLDSDGLLAWRGAFGTGRGGRHVEGARLDAHDLGRERRRFFRRAKHLSGLGALRVFDLLVVEEPDVGVAPDNPESVMLQNRVKKK